MIHRKTIRALIVDDSVLFRETLSKLLDGNGIEVAGTAGDAYEARDKILQLHPDVVTLDIEMPKMSGIDFLKKVIPQYPVPVVVVSSSAISAFDALDAGAVDYVKKPAVKSPADMKKFAEELRAKVIISSAAKVLRPGIHKKRDVIPAAPKNIPPCGGGKDIIIALGASTGGTDALQTVMENLPADSPPIVVVQHMPSGFTKMYADRMNRVCPMEVCEAEDGIRLRRGLAVIGAGEFHLRLKKDAGGYYVSSKRGDKVSGHCPSVDVLFQSVAEVAKADAIGAILTGMGGDGAKGLLAMRKAGAYTIGQNKETCVVYGMPMVAFNIGAVCEQAPLDKISEIIYNRLK